MKKSVYLKLKKIVEEGKSSNSFSATPSNSSFSLLKTDLERTSLVKDTKTKEKVKEVEVPLGNTVMSVLPNTTFPTICKNSARFANRLIQGVRPNFWDSWAHKSLYVSSSIVDFPELQYAEDLLYKTHAQVLTGLKYLYTNKNIKVSKRSRTGVVFANNVGAYSLKTLSKFISEARGSSSAANSLFGIWSCFNIEVRTPNPVQLNLRKKDIDMYTQQYYNLYNTYIYKLLKSIKKPEVSVGDFDFFVIDYNLLVLLVLFDRFPKQFNLKNSNKFFLDVLHGVTSYFDRESGYIINGDYPSVFIWSDKPHKNRLFVSNHFAHVHNPRRDRGELTEQYLDEHYIDPKTSKLGNKEFFDVEAYLSVHSNSKHDSDIGRIINLRRSE